MCSSREKFVENGDCDALSGSEQTLRNYIHRLFACFGQHDHLRVFGADSAELLRDAGFRVEVVRG